MIRRIILGIALSIALVVPANSGMIINPYIYATGGGAGTLIEDFEAAGLTPPPTDEYLYVGMQDWLNLNFPGFILPLFVRSTSHVTQGTYSSYAENGTSSGMDIYISYGGYDISTGLPTLDLSPYSTISIDLYIETIESTDSIIMAVSCGEGAEYQELNITPPGQTGAITLEVDISAIPEPEKSLCQMTMLGYDGSSTAFLSGPLQFYQDNLIGIP